MSMNNHFDNNKITNGSNEHDHLLIELESSDNTVALVLRCNLTYYYYYF